MAKKGLLVLVFMAFVVGGAFAFDISAGLGGNFAANWDTLSSKDDDGKITLTTVGGGGYAFFDLTYVEIDVGMLFGKMTMKMSGGGSSISGDIGTATLLTLGFYGKYPIELGAGTAYLFPMLGMQYDIGLSVKSEGETAGRGDDIGDILDKFWIKFGGGADINLTEVIYLRPTFLYGINFGSKDMNDMKGDGVTGFYHGLDIRFALGFRFFSS